MQRHGISIGIERVNEESFVTLRASGMLSHEDYGLIIPLIEAAFSCMAQAVVRLLVDATELQGWDVQAAWEDLRVGLTHRRRFSKIAIVGTRPWRGWLAHIGSWFSAGEVRYFEDAGTAISWLQQR